MSVLEVEYHPFARVFTDLLEGKTPDTATVQDIKVKNAPKRGIPEGTETEVSVDDHDLDVEPFYFHNTFEDVVEEWRRRHPKDDQLTKVQVNFVTGEVTVFKKLNAAEIANRRKAGKGWDIKKFDMNGINGVRNAASYAFR